MRVNIRLNLCLKRYFIYGTRRNYSVKVSGSIYKNNWQIRTAPYTYTDTNTKNSEVTQIKLENFYNNLLSRDSNISNNSSNNNNNNDIESLQDQFLNFPNNFEILNQLIKNNDKDKYTKLLDILTTDLNINRDYRRLKSIVLSIFNLDIDNINQNSEFKQEILKLLKKLKVHYIFRDNKYLLDILNSDSFINNSCQIDLILFNISIHYKIYSIANKIFQTYLINTFSGKTHLQKQDKDSILINEENLIKLIDCHVVKRPQTDLKDLRIIFELINNYNLLSTKLNKPIFVLPESIILKILEKMSLLNSNRKGNMNSKNISINNDAEIERLNIFLIDEIGYHLSSLNNIIDKENKIQYLIYKKSVDYYLNFVYKLIETKIKINDEASIYSIWKKIMPFHDKYYNSNISSYNNNPMNNYYYYTILGKVISCFSKNKRYRPLIDKLIEDLPIDACKISPELMTNLIYHSSRTKNFELSDILISQYNDETLGLPTRFSPGQIGAIFALSLSKNEFDKAKSTLKFAKDNLIHFSAIEFNELIKATIKRSNGMNISWSMISNAPIKTAKNAYITYLNEMIDLNKMDFNKIQIMFDNAIKNFDKNEKTFWNYWTSSYIKYLTRNFPLDYSIEVYENSTSKSNGNYNNYNNNKIINCNSILKDPVFEIKKFYSHNTNPFLLRYNKVNLFLPHDVKIIVLRTIIHKTIIKLKASKTPNVNNNNHIKDFVQLTNIAFWGINKLKKLGLLKNDILSDLTRSLYKTLRDKNFSISEEDMNSNKLNLKDKFSKNLIGENDRFKTYNKFEITPLKYH
ncbi:hypothetical protein B5S33_g1092 [[Candida] boidinii]|nr:hypothetical protein B5S33_g1092 [[Candida] boidinii]